MPLSTLLMGFLYYSMESKFLGCVILSIILILSLTLVSEAKKGSRGKVRTPPEGPRGLPIFGHLFLLGNLPFRAFNELSKTYGPLFSIRMGTYPAVVVSSPAMAREFFLSHDRHFANRFPLEASRRLFYGSKAVLTMDYGARWKELRRTYAMEILSVRRLEMLRHMRMEEVLCAVREVEAKCRGEEGFSVHLNKLVYSITANAMGRMLLGKRLAGTDLEGAHLREMVIELTRLFGAPVIGDFVPYLNWLDLGGYKAQMSKLHTRLDAFLNEAIRQRMDVMHDEKDVASSPSDFLELLLHINHDNLDEVKASILEMLVGGMETTSTTTEWAMVELIRHPCVMKKMQEEMDRVVGMERGVDELDFPQLSYTHAVVQESMRLHPALPMILHQAEGQSCEIAGYEIPPKTIVLVNTWGVGRDPSIWERAQEFRPERFLQSDGMMGPMNMKGQHFELLPFGSGRRVCPGMHLGVSMVTLILSNLVHSFNWSLLPSPSMPQSNSLSQEELIEALDLTEGIGVTAAIAKPLLVVPKPRRHH